MIKIENLSKDYDFTVLSDINLTLPDAGFIGIVGESGSGKSTLIKCMGLLEKPTSGSVSYGGKDLTALRSLARDRMRGRVFAYISQTVSLIEDETVDKGLSYFCKDAEKRKNVLARLGIKDRAGEIARNLSGGERQRVALAAALLRGAPVLLCDEITSGLDGKNARTVYELLKDISKERLVVCVGHDAALLREYCDREIELAQGKIVSDKQMRQPDKASPALAQKTALGADKFFRIFSRNIKSKLARVIFCGIFTFIALFGFCLGVTQPISGQDKLIRKQLDEIGAQYVQIKEYREGASLAVDTGLESFWTIFADFEEDCKYIELKEGEFPEKGEVLVPEFMQTFFGTQIGDTVSVGLGVYIPCRVSGIIAGNTQAYASHPDKFYDEEDEYFFAEAYSVLRSYYVSVEMLEEYDTASRQANDAYSDNYMFTYRGERILAGEAVEKRGAVLASVAYVAEKSGYTPEQVRDNAETMLAAIQKNLTFNKRDIVITGICEGEEIGFYTTGYAVEYSRSSGYVMPVSQVEDGNFYEIMSTIGIPHSIVDSAIVWDGKISKIGFIIFGISAAIALVLFINLDLYEGDEQKNLFAAMRRAGFSRGSLVVYPFTVNLLILAAVTVLYLIVGVPVIAALQVIGVICYFVLSGWAVVLAPVALCTLALLSWLFTARKFDREICSC